MHSRTILVTLLIVLLSVSVVWAEPFANPPEASGYDWDTEFPYQRNALIDFNTDPSTWRADPNNTDAWDLVPPINGVLNGNGAAYNYHLEGIYDLTLYESDWLEVEVVSGSGPIWYDHDPTLNGVNSSVASGYFGLYDAPEATNWVMTWHLDNLPDERDYKRIWQELDIYFGGQSAFATFSLSSPGVSTIEFVGDTPFDEWATWNLYGEIVPNVEWEELSIGVSLGQGSTFLLDEWHTATECTPEPVSALLLLAGAPIALALRRRGGKDE